MAKVTKISEVKRSKLEAENAKLKAMVDDLKAENEQMRGVLDQKTETGDMTILQAREYLDSFQLDGVNCPACRKLYKVHSRKLEGLVNDLLRLLYAPTDHEGFVDTGKGETTTLLKFWGLIEGGRRRWRITDKGRRWLAGKDRAFEKARIGPQATFLGFVGKEVTINDLFSAAELRTRHQTAKKAAA